MTSLLANAFYDRQKLVLLEPLGATLRLGSVGYFSTDQWVHVGTTRSMFGIRLASNKGSGEPNSFSGSGGKGYSFSIKAAGEVSALVTNPAEAKARVEVSFGSQQGFLMSVHRQQVQTAVDLAELMFAIRWAYHYRSLLPEGKRWEPKYSVIIGVATAASITAVSALSADSAIAIEASGGGAVPRTEAQVRATMEITHSRHAHDKLWLGPAKGYAVQALRLDPSVWTKWDRESFEFERRSASGDSARADRPRRPESFRDWAREGGFADPTEVEAELVPAPGRAARRGRVNELTGAGARKRVGLDRIEVTEVPVRVQSDVKTAKPADELA